MCGLFKRRTLEWGLLVTLLSTVAAARGAVTTSGDVSPMVPPDGNLGGRVDLFVGRTGEGLVDVDGGSRLLTGKSVLGETQGSVGSVTISGELSRWQIQDAGFAELTVGLAGQGRLQVLDQAIVQSGFTAVGELETGRGEISVSDGASLDAWQLSLQRGRVDVTGGGDLNAVEISVTAGDKEGLLIIGDGSFVDVRDELVVGNYTAGLIKLENLAVLTTGDTVFGVNFEGGDMTVENATWHNSDAMEIARWASSRLTIGEDALVTTTTARVGKFGEALGHVHIAGFDGAWRVAEDLYIGNEGIRGGGIGEVRLSDLRTRLVVGDIDPSTIAYDRRAIVAVSDQDGAGGLLEMANGSLLEVGGSTRLGEHSEQSGRVVVRGENTALTNSWELRVGVAGFAHLEVIDGGLAKARNVFLATDP